MTGSYRASIGHNPLIRVKKQSVSLAGQDIGGTIGAGTGPRVGVYWRLTGESITARVNPELNQWDASSTSPIDGARVSHLAQSQFAVLVPADVRALPHFEVIDGTVGGVSIYHPAPLGSDNKYFRGTLYPKVYLPVAANTVNYSPISGTDKPRMTIGTSAVSTAMFSSSRWSYRSNQRLSLGVFLPSDYVEDTDSARETIIQLYGAQGAGDNDFALAITGASGGNAVWRVERTGNGAVLGAFTTAVTNAHKGVWVIHSFFMNIDNRTVANGGSPRFEWVMNVSGQPGTVIATDNTTPWGFLASQTGGWEIQINTFYKGSWHGATSVGYSGNKVDPIVMGVSSIRLGDSTSGYSDAHPTRDAHP